MSRPGGRRHRHARRLLVLATVLTAMLLAVLPALAIGPVLRVSQCAQDTGPRNQVLSSNLPPYSHPLGVTACYNYGVWNEASASLDLFAAPAYYQTNWFRLSCIAVLLALFWSLHRWRVHQLESQEKRLRDVVETIPAMTFTALSTGSATFVNKRWTEYTGLSVEQSSGTGWQSAIHADDLARNSEKWRVSVSSGQLFEDEVRLRIRDLAV